jgi:hypothetical protein
LDLKGTPSTFNKNRSSGTIVLFYNAVRHGMEYIDPGVSA